MILIHKKIDGKISEYNLKEASDLNYIVDKLIDSQEIGITYFIDVDGDVFITEESVTANTFLFNLYSDLTFYIQDDSHIIISEFNSTKEAYKKAIELCDLMKV
jgi:hypothetical protein